MADHVCPWWFCRTFDNPFRRLIHPPQKILDGLIHRGDTALDIGCGMGAFTIALGQLVGTNGQVIAIDLQEKMLQALAKRAAAAGLSERITLHRCQPDRLGWEGRADFALTFWMVHEVENQSAFFQQIAAVVKPGRQLLFVEPIIHVSRSSFQRTIAAAQTSGWEVDRPVSIALSMAVLLKRRDTLS